MISLRNTKTDHISIINSFPFCYVFLKNQKDKKNDSQNFKSYG